MQSLTGLISAARSTSSQHVCWMSNRPEPNVAMIGVPSPVSDAAAPKKVPGKEAQAEALLGS